MSKNIEWLDKEISSLERQLEEKKKLKAFLTTDEIPDTIGERLKKERQLQHLSVFELSAKAGVRPIDIHYIEDNELENITSEVLSKLADTLGIILKGEQA